MNQSVPTTSSAPASREPVFDASVLAAMFGDEPALIASVLQTFVGSTSASLAELLRAMAAQDPGSITSLAHKIAGASRMSGALALGHCARNLEEAAKRGDVAVFQQASADLEVQWDLARAAIAARLAQR